MHAPKRLARIAGLLYLIVAIFGGFAQFGVRMQVYVPGNATATAGNVLANAGLVRVGVVADLLQATVFLFLAMTLYLLLHQAGRNAARAMVILVAIATTMMCLVVVFQFAALLVATDPSYVTAFGVVGASAMVLLLLDLQHYGFLVAQIFFGLWLVPLGYLAFRSAMFPRALSVLLVVGGACYLADMLVLFLAPELGAQIADLIVIPSTIAELWMVGYLLVKGIRSPRRSDLAPAMVPATA